MVAIGDGDVALVLGALSSIVACALGFVAWRCHIVFVLVVGGRERLAVEVGVGDWW